MQLTGNKVHLWWADSRTCPPLVDTNYQQCFSVAELQALNQKMPKVREQACFAKYFLRNILSRYVDQAPRDLSFRYNAYGKPQLESHELHFNVSHSGHYVALALCRDVELGVDIQTMREKLLPLDIAKRFFHQQEYDVLKSLASSVQRQWFYRLWSAKEAVLKACGIGIGATGLKDIVLNVAADDTKAALHIDFAVSTAKFDSMCLQEFFWLSECAFSLATCQATLRPNVFQWQASGDV